MECNLSNKDINEVTKGQIPNDTQILNLSNNKITKIHNLFFHNFRYLTVINLSRNQLTSVACLECFRCLESLDLSYNNLTILALLPLRFIYIEQIKLIGNKFENDTNYKWIYLPAIIQNAMIINDIFITDYVKKEAKELRESKSFCDEIGVFKENVIEDTIASREVSSFIRRMELLSEPESTIQTKETALLQNVATRSQIERLKFLENKVNIQLPSGTLTEKLSVVISILCFLWLGEPASLISNCDYPSYTKNLENIKNWEALVTLFSIQELLNYELNEMMLNKNELEWKKEKEIYDALMVNKYLSRGRIPVPGSTARMIVVAFLARAIASSGARVKCIDDLRIYFKYRRACGLTDRSGGASVIAAELLSPLGCSGPTPTLGSSVSVTHPSTGEWITGDVIGVRDGRIFIRIENIIIQLPQTALFWDGRGIWREAIRGRGNEHSFLEKNKEKIIEVGRETFGQPPPAATRVAPENRSAFLQMGREVMKGSKFIDRTVRKSSTFRGIADPPFSARRNVVRRPANTSCVQIVKKVVNIVEGDEISEGRRLRRFQVQLYNGLSKRTQYVWINEDEVTEYDVTMMVSMYRKQLEGVLKANTARI